MTDPENLRLFASIFEKPKRFSFTSPLMPPSEIEKAAAKALRFHADAIEREAKQMAEVMELKL